MKYIAKRYDNEQCQAILTFNTEQEALDFINMKNLEYNPNVCWRLGE